jgi:Ca2+/Na+ antiporter
MLFEFNSNMLKSVLLLTLAVSGNFVGNTLSCRTQYYLTNNMVVKHIALLFIIYFTLSFTSKDNNPMEFMKTTLMIWVAYLLFTKQNIEFTAVSALLLFASYVLNSFVTYNESKLETETDAVARAKLEKQIKDLSNFRKFTFNAAIVMIVIGFCYYVYEKNLEYGDSFNPLTFILGKPTCKSLA